MGWWDRFRKPRVAEVTAESEPPAANLEDLVLVQVWASMGMLAADVVEKFRESSIVVSADAVRLVERVSGRTRPAASSGAPPRDGESIGIDDDAYWVSIEHMAAAAFAAVTRLTAETLMSAREAAPGASPPELAREVYRALLENKLVPELVAKDQRVGITFVLQLATFMLGSRARERGTDEAWLDAHFPRVRRAASNRDTARGAAT